MVKVIVPNPQYEGVIANVRFHKGVGIFEDKKLAEKIAKQFGFELVKDQPQKVETPKEEKSAEEPKKTPRKRTKKASE